MYYDDHGSLCLAPGEEPVLDLQLSPEHDCAICMVETPAFPGPARVTATGEPVWSRAVVVAKREPDGWRWLFLSYEFKSLLLEMFLRQLVLNQWHGLRIMHCRTSKLAT